MKVLLSKSQAKGKVVAPSSKSYTIRGLMCAALADGESRLLRPLSSDDTDAAANVLGKIGVAIKPDEESWTVRGGRFHKPEGDLFCGDSAATLRFMTAVCVLVPGKCRLTVGPSLARRPVKPLVDALRQLGVDVSCQGELAPVTVSGGRLGGGTTELPGNISSQFVSALLMIAPFAERDMRIRLTTGLESKSYVLMTLECMRKFGIKVSETPDGYEVKKQKYKPARYEIEGDWSSASYFLALGAIAGETEVTNLNPDSLQGDRVLVDLLRRMGASAEVKTDSVVVRKADLRALRANLSECIDLLPTVAVLAGAADGVSELTGIERGRLKESDRVEAVKEGLQRLGIKVDEEPDRLTITGGTPQGAVVDSKGDHRIAMAFSTIGALTGDLTIDGAECVSKTFPAFWDSLKSTGVKLEIKDGK